MRYLRNNLVALDQWLNVLLFNGSPDETISARCMRGVLAGQRRWAALYRLLNWIEPGHCESALRAEIERRQYADWYRHAQIVQEIVQKQ
ncbi:MAG: DNA helicase UvrD [Pseudomonadota bacterium]